MHWLGSLVIVIVLIILNAVISMAETAFVASNPVKIDELAKEGNKKAQAVQNLLSNPNLFLSTIQVGVTLMAFVNGAIGSSAFTVPILKGIFNITSSHPYYGYFVALVAVLVTLFIAYWQIVIGELVPKRMGMKWPEKISMMFVRLIRVIYVAMYPFVWFLTVSTTFFSRLVGIKPGDEVKNVTEEEIRMLVAAGTEKGGINEDEGEMIDNIFEFDDTVVSDIMTHRTEISAISIDATQEEVLAMLVNDKYTRYPVYEGSVDTIIGTIHVKDILKDIVNQKSFNIKRVLRAPYFVHKSKKINDLFKDMQRDKMHIAIILDEYGGTAGIVTIEDVIEEIVGDIDDEYDDFEKDINPISENQYEIDGLASIFDVEDEIEADLPVEDYDTLSGFMIGTLERIPEENEKISIVYNNYKFESLEIKERVITKILATKLDREDE